MFQTHFDVDLHYFDLVPLPLLILNDRGEVRHQNHESENLFNAKGQKRTLDSFLSRNIWGTFIEESLSTEDLTLCPFEKMISLKNSNKQYILKITRVAGKASITYIASFFPYQNKQHNDLFLLEDLPLSIAIIGIDGQFLNINKAFCHLLGYEEELLKEKNDSQLSYPSDFNREIELRQNLNIQSNSAYHIDKRYVHKNGNLIWVRVFVSIITELSFGPCYFVTAFNIHQEKQCQDLIATSEQRFRTIAENVRCVVWISGVDPMRLLYVNECYDDVWEEPVALLYSDPRAFLNKVHPEERESVIQIRFSTSTGSWSMNYCLIFEHGRIKHIRDSGHCVFDSDGELIYRVGTLTDITAEIEQRDKVMVVAKKLRQLVDFDSLTGIKSRRAIMVDINSAFQDFSLTGELSVLVYIDADGFKAINDSYGHEMGDQVLISISEHLESHIRDTDEVGRMGGDEFVILLRHTSLADIPPVLERLSRNINAKQGKDDITVSVSLGAIELSPSIYSSDQWLSEADKTMYHNKRLRKKGSPQYIPIQ